MYLDYFLYLFFRYPDYGFNSYKKRGNNNMSRRTDKKRLKRINEGATVQTAAQQAPVEAPKAVVAEPVAAPAPVKPEYEILIQYQKEEYKAEELAERILEKCKAEGMDTTDLKIYVKPEDKKAYYACAGGNSYVEL